MPARVLVTGSHGGVDRRAATRRAPACAPPLFNDAGRGLDDAGIAGLRRARRASGWPPSPSRTPSPRIADGARHARPWHRQSRKRASPRAFGVAAGMSVCRCSVARGMPRPHRTWSARGAIREARFALARQAAATVGLDSIGCVDATRCRRRSSSSVRTARCTAATRRRALAVAAPRRVLPRRGRRQGEAGYTRLPALEARGIAAGDGATTGRRASAMRVRCGRPACCRASTPFCANWRLGRHVRA